MEPETALMPRKLVYETPLASAGRIIIAAPADADKSVGIRRLAEGLSRYAPVDIWADPPETAMTKASGPVIVIGNLADSRCVRHLYYHYLCVTDRWYPGPQGYEIRTLLNPFATGHNLVHVGYSDEKGLAAALDALPGKLADPLPYLSEVRATRLPIADNEVYKIRHGEPAQFDWQVSNRFDDALKGYLGYLTGDRDLLEQYAELWKTVIGCGLGPTEKIVQTHIFMWSRVVVWRLLEQTGMIREDMRVPILQFVYDWAESSEGYRHLDIPFYNSPYFPRHNHGTIPAMGLIYAADYFETHYPRRTEAKVWRQAADATFAPYMNGSWKAICDGLCHGWWLTLPPILEYGLMDPEHRYFENGGARRAAENAVAIVNNRGWMPSAGDSDLMCAFPGYSLRVAAAYYEDGTYKFVHDTAPVYRSLYAMWGGIPVLRAFATDLPAAEPIGHVGITIVPMDPLIYNMSEREPEMAQWVFEAPPSVPLESCFDKIALRSGWHKDDDYMLIDGLGSKGASHAYADAMGIHDYSRFGVTCIVTEDLIFFPEPESHSLVTVTKDGESGIIPCFAELQASGTDEAGHAYLRMRLPGYAGTDWIREVFFLPGCCAVFHDTIVANEEGSYAVEAHFRIPSRIRLTQDGLTSFRKSDSVGEVAFIMKSRCSEPAVLLAEDVPVHLNYRNHPGEPQPLSPEDDFVVAWKRRYQTDDVCLTAFTTRSAVRLKAGESVSITHSAQIRGPGEAECSFMLENGNIVLSCGDKRTVLTTHRQGSREPTPPLVLPASPPSALPAPQAAVGRTRVARFDASGVVLKRCGADRLLCALADGTLAMIGTDGGSLWQTRLEGTIHDFSVLEDTGSAAIFVGHGDDRLTALDADGRRVWERTIVREPCPWPWWELPYPTAVQVACGRFGDRTLLAVGCGDIQMRLFDSEGNQLWMWRYNEGVPGRIRVADVDGDGVNEIIVGGDISTDNSTCRILNDRGEMLWELIVEGWTSRMTALEWKITADGRKLIACGANRGRNLRLYALATETAHDQQSLLCVRLGGWVTGIVLDDATDTLYAGTSQGFLCAYSFAGDKLWFRMFARGIVGLFAVKDRLLVVESDGRLHLLSKAGETLFAGEEALPAQCLVPDGELLYAASGREIYRLAVADGR